jgi:hypothetical protein
MAVTSSPAIVKKEEVRDVIIRLAERGPHANRLTPVNFRSSVRELAWSRLMPLKRLLKESGSFGPTAVATLVKAYDGLVGDLGLKATDEKERAAKLIIDLAQHRTDLDAASIRGLAARLLKEADAAH